MEGAEPSNMDGSDTEEKVIPKVEEEEAEEEEEGAWEGGHVAGAGDPQNGAESSNMDGSDTEEKVIPRWRKKRPRTRREPGKEDMTLGPGTPRMFLKISPST
ncbi:uncharacterized protein [Engystomops pustulosus]|uniref:uncharacterized protein isoform X5 n=1 Tax=Engystomops pustulosus TaxID=76066 RepID=UPI003AFA360B